MNKNKIKRNFIITEINILLDSIFFVLLHYDSNTDIGDEWINEGPQTGNNGDT